MDTVTIDGVEYTKASVLAKKHRYTTDYVGQLCRANKVDAHLVGRTWYVYADSLNSHKDTRYNELRSNKNTSNTPSKKTLSRPVVNSPLPKKVPRPTGHHFENHVLWKAPRYESDQSELLPEVKPLKTKSEQRLPITLADSEKLRVVKTSENITMISQPMPAVALAGTLKVLDFNPDIDQEEVEKPSYSEKVTEEAEPLTPAVAVDHTEQFRKKILARTEPTTVPVTESLRAPVTPQRQRRVDSTSYPSLAIPAHVPDPAPPNTSLVFGLVSATLLVLGTVVIVGFLSHLESVTAFESGGRQAASLRFDVSVFERIFGTE